MQPRNRAWWWLAAGVVLLVLAHTRFGVGAFAWVAPVPWLAALRARSGWRFRAAFAAVLVVAWTAAVLKIVTPPVPAVFALAFGVPIALVHLPAYLAWDHLVARGRDGRAMVAFATITALAEWAQAELTPAGVWGSTTASQAGHLAALQVLALAGMPGLSFLVSLMAATIEAALVWRAPTAALIGVPAAAGAALVWGAVRSEAAVVGPIVRVAMVRTDSTVGLHGLPSDAERRRDQDTLLRRTTAAAAAGAQLVVWPEAANLVFPAEEQAYVTEMAQTAREHHIELVVAYIAPLSLEPLRYENRARWFAPDGTERLAYLKLHPVPAEPAVKGEGPAPAFDASFGRASLAICYDYDFPAVARAHARMGAGLVALPSSDWEGIDPIHTEMAAMRAVEGGFSIVRSTRYGLSAAIDAHGRLLAQQSTNDSTEPYVMASLPVMQVQTLYTKLGNLTLVPLLLGAVWSLSVFGAARRPFPPLHDQRS